MRHLADLLLSLAGRAEAPRALDAESLDRIVGGPVRRAASLLDDESARRLHALGASLRDALLGVPVRRVPRHGDFKLENVLGRPFAPETFRILDWELWTPCGLPLLDAWHLVASNRAREQGCSMGKAVERWLVPGELAVSERGVIEALGRELDARYVALSPLLYWLDRVGPVAARGAWPQGGWERANLLPVLDTGIGLVERTVHAPLASV
jgi:hypothetical protein